jgi:hypothetical protein
MGLACLRLWFDGMVSIDCRLIVDNVEVIESEKFELMKDLVLPALFHGKSLSQWGILAPMRWFGSE